MVLLTVCAALAWQPAMLSSYGPAWLPRMRVIDTPLHYEGGLLGVKAELKLYRHSEKAVITLKGVPLGGTITGVAWFDKDGFNVKLDNDLKKALGWRRVQIEGAGAFHDYSKVWVLLKLPLGLGRHTLSLARKL